MLLYIKKNCPVSVNGKTIMNQYGWWKIFQYRWTIKYFCCRSFLIIPTHQLNIDSNLIIIVCTSYLFSRYDK